MLLPRILISKSELQSQSYDSLSAQCETMQKYSILSSYYARADSSFLQDFHSQTDEKQRLLSDTFQSTRVILGDFQVSDIDTALTWLDTGIRTVVIHICIDASSDISNVCTQLSLIPAHRLILRMEWDAKDLIQHFDNTSDPSTEQKYYLKTKLLHFSNIASGIILTLKTHNSQLNIDQIIETLECIRKEFNESFFFAIALQEPLETNDSLPIISILHRKKMHYVAAASVSPDKMNTVDVPKAFVKCLRSDRLDGLYPTVVVNECGFALGLVYSSDESILNAFYSGRGVYFSRSRQMLWKKGETSGDLQTLLQFDLDCDSDALRVMVRQEGDGFCHLKQSSCWGQANGLRSLETMLQSRLSDPPVGSYTKRLLDDMDLLRDKLVEEAQELAEAATKEEIMNEAADLFYFALVRCIGGGVKLADIERQLEMRSLKVQRRAGNAKQYRNERAKEILKRRKVTDATET